jgi:GT2 family glycosyltransferase
VVDLSIVIVNYNTKALLGECLKSIYGQATKLTTEVWVVDNASGDGSVEAISRAFPKALMIANDENRGFSAAANAGLVRRKGRYGLLLNPDTVILDGAFDRMIEFMDAHEDVGILGPKIYDDREKKSVQLSCRRFPAWHTFISSRYSLLTRLFPNNRWSADYLMLDCDHNSVLEADWVSGSCMLVRSGVLDEIGLFDEGFFMFNEDVDFCYRARQKGWKVAYLPQAEVIHYIGASKGKVEPRLIVERHKSIQRYIRKHLVRNRLLTAVVQFFIFLRGGYLLVLNALKR